jgi:uncharacterized protein (TIGR00725 family)
MQGAEGTWIAKMKTAKTKKGGKQKKPSIAVCGAVSGANDKKVMRKSALIGKEIAKQGRILYTGGCGGYPDAAAKAAYGLGGEVIAISPAHNVEEQRKVYHYPTHGFTRINYTGLGIPGRNMPLVKGADAIIIVGGQHGTMIEYGLGLHFEKPIGILLGSGGMTGIARQIAKICRKKDKKQRIIYESEPEKLVRRLLRMAEK